MERAENTARILHINETYAREHPDGPIWSDVLELFSDTEAFQQSNTRADAASVLRFYVLDRNNPTSITSAIINARENARSVRHLISTEMWTQINIFHSRVLVLDEGDIRLSNLSRLAQGLVVECQSFEGVTEGTLLRGEAWGFYHLGKYIERADQTTRVLDIGYRRLSLTDQGTIGSVQWHALLRSVSGYHAFRSRHPAASGPSDITNFLLYDDEFPRAVLLCVKKLTERLQDIEQRHDKQRHDQVEQARLRLTFALDTGSGSLQTPEALHGFLDRTQSSLAELSSAISNTYF